MTKQQKLDNKKKMTWSQFKRRLTAIETCTSDDFMMDMDCKLNMNDGRDKNTFTQEEAQEMAGRLLEIYEMSHSAVSSCCLGQHENIVDRWIQKEV